MSSSLFKKYNETIELSLSISYQQPVPRLEVYIWGQLAREVPPDSRESELLLSFGSLETLVLTACSGWTDSQHPLLYWNRDHRMFGFSTATACNECEMFLWSTELNGTLHKSFNCVSHSGGVRLAEEAEAAQGLQSHLFSSLGAIF